jgi:elongation factor P
MKPDTSTGLFFDASNCGCAQGSQYPCNIYLQYCILQSWIYNQNHNYSESHFKKGINIPMQANDIRRGMIIMYNNVPHRVMDFQHRTPGNLRAFVQAKLRNIKTGSSTEVRFSSTENIERAMLEEHEMEYMYSDGDMYHFMNTETYDQIALDNETLGDAMDYLVAGAKIKIEFFENSPMGVELPPAVELTVVETAPELKGATASNSPKPAKLETGVTIQVPPFIKEGDRIRVDPTKGVYLERAK